MLSLGITQINNVLSEEDRITIKNGILESYSSNKLNNESNDNHYRNSYGGEVYFEDIYNKLTSTVSALTNLKITKANSYSRIYFNDSTLTEHTDREGLDLTLSIQIENTFNTTCSLYGESYDGTVFKSDLNNNESVLLKGNELKHWRTPIFGEGYLMCIFFHWTITEVQYQEVNNFVSLEYCTNTISKANEGIFNDSAVLADYTGSKVDIHSRNSKSLNWIDQYLNDKLKPYIGNLALETWQLLKYEEGNAFIAHYDNGGSIDKRVFTILIYLNSDFEGGTTTFNNNNITIIPEKGKMVIFKNLKNRVTDTNSMHSGDKIISGVKYVLVNWANYI